MKTWERAIECMVYLGLIAAMLMAAGLLVGNADVMIRELIDNLLTGVAHFLVR